MFFFNILLPSNKNNRSRISIDNIWYAHKFTNNPCSKS